MACRRSNFAAQAVDIALLDVRMPNMDGVEGAAHFRNGRQAFYLNNV